MIKTLNTGILEEAESVNVKGKWLSGDVLVNKEDLQADLDELRSLVWTLLCCYEEGNPEYALVFEEVEKNGGLARFNDTDDDY